MNLQTAINPHIIIGIPVLFWGGTEIQSLTLIQALQEMGYCVTVCCYHEYDPTMIDEVQRTGAQVDLLDLARGAGHLSTFNALRKYFKNKKPLAVHVRYIAPGLVPVLAARAAGIKNVIITVGQLGTPYGLIPKLLIRIACVLSKCVICTTREVEKSWFGKSYVYNAGLRRPRKHCTIFNGVKIDAVASISRGIEEKTTFRTKYSIPRDKKILAVVGRLRSEKGQMLALQAMAIIAEQMPETLLLFAGEGPDADILKQKTRELRLESNVRFLGRLDPAEVFSLYRLSSCLIIPSTYEGFGLVAVEAMAARIPVVATNVGGLKDIVKDGETGYLVPVARGDIMAKKVIKILRSENLAESMSYKGFQRVNDIFSYEVYSKKLSNLFAVILKPLQH